MPLWPEQVKERLEVIFGKDTVEMPLSFTRGRKTPHGFIECGSVDAVQAVMGILQASGIDAALSPRYERHGYQEAYRTQLAILFNNEHAESDVARIELFADHLRETLANPPKRLIPGVVSRAGEVGSNLNSLQAPEELALLQHQLEKTTDQREQLDIIAKMIPPQMPAPLEFVEHEGRFALATEAERQALHQCYAQAVEARKALLPNPAADRMFNPATGEIELLPPGEVLRRLQAGKFDELGPATFLDKRGAYRELTPYDLAQTKKAALGTGI